MYFYQNPSFTYVLIVLLSESVGYCHLARLIVFQQAETLIIDSICVKALLSESAGYCLLLEVKSESLWNIFG